MPETMEQVQQEAYVRGQQMKQWHLEQQRVVNDEALTILAADFAQVYLFKSNQHMTVGAAHERAGLYARERFRRATVLSFCEAGAENELTPHPRVIKSQMMKER